MKNKNTCSTCRFAAGLDIPIGECEKLGIKDLDWIMCANSKFQEGISFLTAYYDGCSEEDKEVFSRVFGDTIKLRMMIRSKRFGCIYHKEKKK